MTMFASEVDEVRSLAPQHVRLGAFFFWTLEAEYFEWLERFNALIAELQQDELGLQ